MKSLFCLFVWQPDWTSIFVPTVSLFEIFLRGSLTYLFLLLLLRLLRRDAGAMSMADLLVVVLIADAAQNAMASEYKSVTEGAVLVLTIGFWNYMINWLCFHFPAVERLISPPPLLLIKNGQLQRRNMRQEMISTEELLEQLREQGVADPAEVKQCCLEGDGHISIIRQDAQATNRASTKHSF